MAIWFDRGQRFLDGRHHAAATFMTIPARIAFWVCTDSVLYTLVTFQNEGTRDNHISICVDGSGYVFVFRWFKLISGFQTDTLTASTVLTRNKWAHVLVEYLSTSDIRLTINGTSQVLSTATVQVQLPGNVHFGVGSNHALGAPYYPDVMRSNTYRDPPRGYIDDFAIWRGIGSGGLSSAERAQLASMSRPHKYFDRSNLNVYMPLSGGVDDLVNLDTVAGGGTAFWTTKPALQTRRAAYVEASADPSDGDTVTVDTTTYTFRNTVSVANDVKIAGSANATLINLGKAIELTGVAGTDYGSGTTKHATCMARTIARGNQNNETIFIQEIDPTATGTAPAISKSGTNLVGPFDIDGNSASALVAPPEVMLAKRPDWIWNETSLASDIGQGANNHAHRAPINHGVPFTGTRMAG